MAGDARHEQITDASVRMAVIVHRHGERLPTKVPGPAELTWPQSKSFWKSLGGELSPVGIRSMGALGAALRRRYSAGSEGGLLGHSHGGADGRSRVRAGLGPSPGWGPVRVGALMGP